MAQVTRLIRQLFDIKEDDIDMSLYDDDEDWLIIRRRENTLANFLSVGAYIFPEYSFEYYFLTFTRDAFHCSKRFSCKICLDVSKVHIKGNIVEIFSISGRTVDGSEGYTFLL